MDIHAKEKEEKIGLNLQLQIDNELLEMRVATMENRLSNIEYPEWNNEQDEETNTRTTPKTFKRIQVEGLDDLTPLQQQQQQQHACGETTLDEPVTLCGTSNSDSNEDLRYCDGGGGDVMDDTLSVNSLTECVLESPLLSQCDDAVRTCYARIKSHDDSEEDQERATTTTITNTTKSTTTTGLPQDYFTKSNRNSTLDDSDADDDEEGDCVDHANVRYSVTVDVHSNRKDFKKLQLQQEQLHDTLVTTLRGTEHDMGVHLDELYEQSSSSGDSKSVRSILDDHTTSFHHWDDVDSKTSYEDVASLNSSSDDEKLHMYFILDKKNMSAKQVEQEEYKHFLEEKSMSLSKFLPGGDGIDLSGGGFDAFTPGY